MTEINIDALEPNSHKYKAEKANAKNGEERDRKKNSPIINREQIVSTKKPISKKIAEVFMPEDVNDVKKWLFKDVIVPGIQNTILDILNMLFYGEIDSRSRRGCYRRDDRVPYGSYYGGNSSNQRDRNSRRRRDDRYDSDDNVDFRNIVLRNRSDAEELINALRNRIRDERSVSVADLLDLIDVPGRYTDNNWGWDDERDIGIRRVSAGFLIDVAEPKYLNQ